MKHFKILQLIKYRCFCVYLYNKSYRNVYTNISIWHMHTFVSLFLQNHNLHQSKSDTFHSLAFLFFKQNECTTIVSIGISNRRSILQQNIPSCFKLRHFQTLYVCRRSLRLNSSAEKNRLVVDEQVPSIVST